MAKKGRIIRTIAELATACDRSKSTVGGWVKHPAWPFPRKGPWKPDIIAQALRWSLTLNKGRPEADPDADPDSFNELRKAKLRAEIRRTEAQADQAETALAKERGQLLDAATVEREWASVGVIIRNGVENIPSQVVPLALTHGMPDQASGKFQDQVEEIIAGVLRHLSRDGESEESEDGAAPVLPQPVPA